MRPEESTTPWWLSLSRSVFFSSRDKNLWVLGSLTDEGERYGLFIKGFKELC